MLNIKQFYDTYGLPIPPSQEMVQLGDKLICAHSQKVFIVCQELHQEAFSWLVAGEDAIVFETAAGYLSIMLLFDSEKDETDRAIVVCNRLIGLVH